MRRQQQIWQDEHLTTAAIPSLATAEPSGGLVKFLDLLATKNLTAGKAVDIGCGKGRNSVYLAEQGFETAGLDYIEPALVAARQLADNRQLTQKIQFIQTEIDAPWPFIDNYFNVAVDSFSSIDIESLKGREVCRDEMFRTLKPGGFAMVTVVSADDEWEKELIANSPGAEPNSTIWPQNGKFQKDYDEQELREFYKAFKIVDLQKISRPSAIKLNRHYTATNFWLVLQKD